MQLLIERREGKRWVPKADPLQVCRRCLPAHPTAYHKKKGSRRWTTQVYRSRRVGLSRSRCEEHLSPYSQQCFSRRLECLPTHFPSRLAPNARLAVTTSGEKPGLLQDALTPH